METYSLNVKATERLKSAYASLWEVELMETLLSHTLIIQEEVVRFPLGSGINGNLLFALRPQMLLPYASLWEVELMET